MTEGTVKWFYESKGYGFIEHEEYGAFFFHRSAIEGRGAKTLKEGAKVSFKVVDGPNKQLVAANVVKL